MSMMSHESSPGRMEQAVLWLASNLSEQDYLNDDLRASAFREGMEIVRSVKGIKVLSEQPGIATCGVHGSPQAIETLRLRLKESGRDLTMDDPEKPMFRVAQ